MQQLPLTYFVDVSIASVGLGVGRYNTSNIALFSREAKAPSFGLLGYKIYKSPTQVGLDFGTNSNTYKMAVSVFSQSPNILANQGYLVVIPFESAETLAAAIARTKDLVQYFGIMAAEITSEANGLAAAAVVQTLNKMQVLSSNDADDVATGGYLDLLRQQAFDKSRGLFFGFGAVTEVQTIQFSSLPTAGAYTLEYNGNSTASLAFGANAAAVEAALQAVAGLATVDVIGTPAQGFEVTFTGIDGDALLLVVSANTLTDANTNDVSISILEAIPGYSSAQAVSQVLINTAAYLSRGLSVNFSGSNTTLTMHGKTLAGALPDPSMDESLLGLCQAAGADVYASFVGVPKVFTSGKNRFFDQVYNQEWISGAIQAAYANVIMQNSTKIAQTEDGVNLLKSAVRKVCEQGKQNQYLAPGSWTSPNTFGVLEDFISNIENVGYYIYTLPISQQDPIERADRIAPLMQIALKEAGAIHSGSVILNINP